jgi:hypothetical protein
VSGLSFASGCDGPVPEQDEMISAMTAAQCMDWMMAHGGRLVWDNYLRSCYVEIGAGLTRRVGPWRTGRWAAIQAAMVCIGTEQALMDFYAGTRVPARG